MVEGMVRFEYEREWHVKNSELGRLLTFGE